MFYILLSTNHLKKLNQTMKWSNKNCLCIQILKNCIPLRHRTPLLSKTKRTCDMWAYKQMWIHYSEMNNVLSADKSSIRIFIVKVIPLPNRMPLFLPHDLMLFVRLDCRQEYGEVRDCLRSPFHQTSFNIRPTLHSSGPPLITYKTFSLKVWSTL